MQMFASAQRRFDAGTTAPSINRLRIEENLCRDHLLLSGGAYIEQLDSAAYVDCYDRPHTLFYLDPPYSHTEGYSVPFKNYTIKKNDQRQTQFNLNQQSINSKNPNQPKYL